jgi:hypothetical protein
MEEVIKEFVPYEQALELKELGFNKPCIGVYAPNYYNNDKIELSYDDGVINGLIGVQDGTYTLAPTYSQAFKWFRNKHNLHSCVAPTYKDENHLEIIYWYWIQGVEEKEELSFNTPEEAELACLKKLIEIVKTK